MNTDLIDTKRGLRLDRVVLLGRTFEEYRRYFLLEPKELIGKDVLDVAGGVSSFCAEANARGIPVTSSDPIYSLPAEQIAERSEPDLESVYPRHWKCTDLSLELLQNPSTHARVLRACIFHFCVGLQKPS